MSSTGSKADFKLRVPLKPIPASTLPLPLSPPLLLPLWLTLTCDSATPCVFLSFKSAFLCLPPLKIMPFYALLFLRFLHFLLQSLDLFFLFFFFLQVLRLFATLWVMTDSKCLYLHALAWPLALKFVPFCVFSPWYLLYLRLLGYPLLNLVKQVFTCLIVFSSPFYLSFLRPFSSSYPRCFQKL